MPINPQIPLMAQPQINPAPGLQSLGNAIVTGKRLETLKAESKQTNELRGLQIEQIQGKLNEQGRAESARMYSNTVDVIDNLLDAGADDIAAQVALEHKSRMAQMQKDNPRINTRDVDIFLDTLLKDPQKARQLVKAEKQNLISSGIMKGPKLEQGKGDMEGYVFNADTGEFSIAPEVESFLKKSAEDDAKTEGLLDPNQVAGVNDKVTALTKDVRDAYDAASALDGLKGRGTPAAKIGAIFKFMKSLDPSSTVRESEGRMVLYAEGAAKGFAQQVNQILGEGPLSETNFEDLVQTSKVLANSAIGSAEKAVSSYLGVLDDKITPEDMQQMRSRVPTQFEVSPADVRLQEGDEVPEGTIIEVPTASGSKKQILRDGNWVDVQE